MEKESPCELKRHESKKGRQSGGLRLADMLCIVITPSRTPSIHRKYYYQIGRTQKTRE